MRRFWSGLSSDATVGFITVAFVCLTLIVCCWGVVAIFHSAPPPTHATTTTAAVAHATATPRPTATDAPIPTATPFKTVTVFSQAGRGNTMTQDFTVGDYWDLTWTCDRASAGGTSYNVIIQLVDPVTSQSTGTLVNALCEQGNTGGTAFTTSPTPGDWQLQILSEGAWTVTVQEDQPG